MKNLYEQLKPEIRDSIQADLEKYPTSTKLLIDKLTKNTFWQDLNVNDVQKVILWSHHSLVELSHNDLLYGDKFLIEEN